MSRPVPESLWSTALAGHDLRPLPTRGFSHATVVAAHPDDETLGAGGLLQCLAAEGTGIRLVVATDGEAAFPRSSREQQRELGRVRRGELRDSLGAQGLGGIEVHWLGLPDSGLCEHTEDLAGALRHLIDGSDLCLMPWPDDPHPDHQEAGRAALLAAPVTTHCWSYPIWLWHRLRPGDPAIPWTRASTHRLDGDARVRKSAAITASVSQLKRGPNGEEPILPREVLAHFERGTEVFFREPPTRSARRSRFSNLYRAEADPWQVSSRWYERRKRATALAALPDERYGAAVEPACGTGAFTRELGPRCERLLAFDPVPAAVDQARAATAGLPQVRVQIGEVPGDLPAEPVDLLVYSEILYYLDDEDLARTIERSVAALRPGGHLLAAHWLPWAPEAPRDGRDAHRHLLTHSALETLVEHSDEDFLLHVLRRR